jgi:hypothetical protein
LLYHRRPNILLAIELCVDLVNDGDNPIGSDHTFQATILARNEVCIDGIKLLQDADSGSRPTQ